MKSLSRIPHLLRELMAVLVFMLAGGMSAQTFKTLHRFNNAEGAYPSGLILSGNTLYGVARWGGSWGNGTVFALNIDGAGFTNLHSFADFSDGAFPVAILILTNNTLYGTTAKGGRSGQGTVFSINTDGAGFTNLHSFTGSNGTAPSGKLMLSGNTLYGTTYLGGSSGRGTVFALNTDGNGFTNLYGFTTTPGPYGPYTNSDGAYPSGGLILSGNMLYGTAYRGGSAGLGSVFAVNTNGMGFTNLHSFAGVSDGANPNAGLILLVTTLYGVAEHGGSSDRGAVFAVNTDGTAFTNLHSFTELSDLSGTDLYINSDGAHPSGELVLSGNTLYGVARWGGSWGSGTVFAINTDGTGFKTLHSFAGGSNGAWPFGRLILSGNILYGTTYDVGSSGRGTVFRLLLPPPPRQLTIIRSEAGVILTWPTGNAGFTLQSAGDIASMFTNLPGATSPYTNPISGTQQFFRLISN